MDNSQFWAFLLIGFLVGGLVGYGMGNLQKGVVAKAQAGGDNLNQCVGACVTFLMPELRSVDNIKQCQDGCSKEPSGGDDLTTLGTADCGIGSLQNAGDSCIDGKNRLWTATPDGIS